MKHKKTLIILISLSVLLQVIGAALNGIVKSLNRGMPVPGLTEAFDNHVPINQGTQLAFLADVIRIGGYALSVGDLLLIAGIFTCFIALWIALPQGRKFFPILIVSVIGIYLSVSLQNAMTSRVLCETAAAGSVVAMYWSYRSSIRKKATVKE